MSDKTPKPIDLERVWDYRRVNKMIQARHWSGRGLYGAVCDRMQTRFPRACAFIPSTRRGAHYQWLSKDGRGPQHFHIEETIAWALGCPVEHLRYTKKTPRRRSSRGPRNGAGHAVTGDEGKLGPEPQAVK